MKIRQVAFGLHLAHKGSDCGVDDHLGADDDSSSSSLNAGTKVMVKWDDGKWYSAFIEAVNSDGTFDVHSCYGEWYCRNYNIYYTFTLIKVSTYFILFQ